MMQSFLIVVLVFFSLQIAALCNATASDDLKDSIGNVTIFIYHKFGEDNYPTTNVAVKRFAEQLHYLHDNGYQVLALKNVVSMLEKRLKLPEKCAVITIDDGYTSTYTEAWPLLQQFDYPFTVFLYVEAVDRKFRNFLTWAQIDEMRGAGVDFQDHGYSHHRFGNMPKGMGKEAYRQWLLTDLDKGNTVLASHLGERPEFLALPYGEYNSVVQEVARKLGYKAVFSQDPGSVSRFTDLYSIPREPILGKDWASMKHFAEVLKRKDLPLTNPIPPPVPLSELRPQNFCATLKLPHLYKADRFGIYVSELGWRKADLDGNTLCINNKATLVRRSNRVAVSAVEKDGGVRAMRYWLLINKDKMAP